MGQDFASKILIVEDDPGVCRLQQRRLERAGYQVACAQSPEEALRKIQEDRIELVLLDYRLPNGSTGLDFYSQLKAAGHDLPVILVTGFSDDATVIEALRAGVRDFVTKSPEYLDYLPDAARRVLDQVQTESQLAESKARLAALIDSAMDAILTLDETGRITLFNPSAEEIFQCRAAAAIGEPIERFIPDRLPEAPPARAGQSGRGPRHTHLEMQGVRKGEPFPLEGSLSVVELPGHSFRTLMLRDITERRHAEEQIREQAALLDEATDAIYVRDLNSRVLFWNRGAERLYGWTREEALGKTALELIYAEAPEEFEQANQALLEKGHWTGELIHQTKSGARLNVTSRWTLVRDREGRPRYQLIINTDITEKKKLEAQYLRAQRLESIGRLAGGIAHDLNNILAQFLMALECLKEDLPPEDRQALLGDLQTRAQRGADIVKQVLSFASGIEGKKVVFEPRHLIRDMEKMLRHTLPRSIEVRIVLPPRLWSIQGDATQVYQILMNLCINAVDAMPEGGQLTVSAQNIVLDENYCSSHVGARPGPFVLIQVADTGMGIPRDVQDKIFEPFFTTKGPGKGTGLGLSTVLGIVRSHGGFINVYSELGRGTEFAVYLPAVVADQAQPSEQERPELPVGHGELILVVDDESSFRLITRATLENFGYRVLTANDGAEAVAVYAQHPQEIQVVLTDMMMPIMDGAATVRALRRLNPAVRIIAASGLAGNGRQADLASLGVQAFLQKPYAADKLLKTLRDVLAAPVSAS